MSIDATRPPFELVLEIDPPTKPSLIRARHQIGVLGTVADRFLVPDNHLGRATVSSIAVAREVAAMGGRAIACLNSRDRNVLGFRRDLLTAAAYDVESFLLVYGDRPDLGRRSDDVSVGRMMEEIRTFGSSDVFAGCPPFEIGVTTRLTDVPAFKHDADFVVTQVSHSIDDLARWRDTTAFDGPVYAGVMVVASAAMARKLGADSPQLTVPPWLIDAVDADRDAGVEAACALVDAVAGHGGFAGAHVVSVGRYRQVAARLEASGWARTSGRARPTAR
ncbi:MAG: methylenetetrahydrofolate reductase [Ilumatobacteraceae bacterium]